MLIKKTVHLFLGIMLVLFISSLKAATTLKVGILAPKGTTWEKELEAMSKEILAKTNKEVEFKIFYGGTQGDEPTVLRKNRSKQLQGGIFTGRTLGEISGAIRLMEIPFTFSKREDAYNTLLKMEEFFNKKFAENHFVNLGTFEIGQVYLMSTKKADSFASLHGIKIWTWAGDPLAQSMIEAMNLVSVPLALPDVLSSLSTGIIEAAYAPPMATLAVQWQTKVKFLIDYPITYSVGAFLIQEEAFKKLSAQNQQTVKEVAKKYIDSATLKTVSENNDALKSMELLKIQFLKFPDSDIKEGAKIREKVIKSLTNKLFTASDLAFFEQKIKEATTSSSPSVPNKK